jgi:hypothetical protein
MIAGDAMAELLILELYPRSRGFLASASTTRRDDPRTRGRVGLHSSTPRSEKGETMPRLVITHEVVDVERWLEGKAEGAAAIGSAGTNVIDYVALDGSSQVTLTADIDDLDAIQALLAPPPPDVVAQMERHGVRPPITAFIER